MPIIDKGLEMPHVIEERRINFQQFVLEQSGKGSPGMPNAVLHSNGHRDFYGPAIFEPGITRGGRWVLPLMQNPTVLIYTNRDEARNYAKSLQPILRNNGFFNSTVRVQRISVHYVFANPHSSLLDPDEFWEDEDRYIIRLKVQ